MAKTVIPKGGKQDSASTHPLWAFMTALSGVSDEFERARLTATGLPSFLACHVSGVALVDESETAWSLIIQKDGHPVGPPRTEQIRAELDPLFQQALRKPSVLIATSDGETDNARIPPSIAELGVQSLAVAPLRTLRRRLGMVLAGRENPQRFSREDELVLSTLAGHSAIGLENLRLHKSLEKYSKDLQSQNELILRAAGEGIYGLDTEGKTTFVNPAAAKMLGWEAEELIGQPMHTVLHHTKPDGGAFPREECPVYAAFKDGKVHRVDDEVFWRKDGSSFPVEYTSTPILESGKLTGAVVVFWDITERKQAEDALHNALTEVRQLTERLEAENVYLQEEIKTTHNFEEIIGQGRPIKGVLKAIETVAPTDASVLVLGETGTGKELVARAIHNLSPRKDKALVKVNCAALPSGLIESELFGHEKGAFTGALSRRIGRFELAHGGTIFLDEIGDLPLELQAKLLRVLQDGEFERVGGTGSIKVNVRVIAATNRDLEKSVQEQHFRQDLFYRLNVFPIHIPALRERKEDIPLLVKYFSAKYGKKLGRKIETVPKKVMDSLTSYTWPGNARELENVIERSVILSPGSQLELADWLPKQGISSQGNKVPTLEELERRHIIEVLEMTSWRVSGDSGAARFLDVKPTTLESRMKKLGISRKS